MYLSTRDGSWLLPRAYGNGLPADLQLTRFISSLFRSLLSSVVSGKCEKLANARLDHVLYGIQPSHSILTRPMVVNDDLPSRILSGSVQVRPGIDRLTSSGVQFTDGTCVDDVSTIICATGNSVIFVNENENGEKRENNEFVNEN